MTAQYVLGIDLGTTNSVVAYASLQEETPQVQLLPIPQVVDVNTVEERSALAIVHLFGGRYRTRKSRSALVVGT